MAAATINAPKALAPKVAPKATTKDKAAKAGKAAAPKVAEKAKAATPKAAAAPKAAPAKAAAAAPKAANDVNPYREGGGYWATVEALRGLGVGKLHAFDAIVPAVIRAMGAERYKAFKAKDARNENGKDATARLIQNVGVTARADYGEPLRKLGYEVRFDGREKVAGLFKIGKVK